MQLNRYWYFAALIGLMANLPPAVAQEQAPAPQPTTEAAEQTPADEVSADETPAADEAGAEAGAQQVVDEDGQPMTVKIVGVQGMVQVRDTPDSPWKKAESGMVVDQGAEFRTGLRSWVRFTIGEDHLITLDRLGVIKVLQAIEREGFVKTDVGMEYGRVDYKVEEAGVEHESTIHSPGATLAVRGSEVWVANQLPLPPRVGVQHSRETTYTDRSGKQVKLQQGQIEGEAAPPSEHRRRDSTNPPTGDGMVNPDAPETRLAGDRPGALQPTGGESTTQLNTYSNNQQRNEQLQRIYPGELNFVMSYLGQADVDLSVVSPLGEIMHVFEGPYTTPSGGRMTRDHTGPDGREIAYWEHGEFPTGTYTVNAELYGTTGGGATVKIEAYRGKYENATKIGETFNATLTPENFQTTTQFNVSPGGDQQPPPQIAE